MKETKGRVNPKPSVTIYPREVAFEEVQSHGCYEIPLFVRNEGREMEKIRIIEPATKMFKVKLDENYTHSLAPGLTIKLTILFTTDKNIPASGFADQLFVCGNTFKEPVALQAFPLREKLIVPDVWNIGRMVINRDNTVLLPVKNEGKVSGRIKCETLNSLVNIVTRQITVEAGCTNHVELRIRSKKAGNFEQTLLFSNKAKCALRGAFVEQFVDILNSEGEKMTLIDLGQVFIGEKVEYPFFLLNNTEKAVSCVFKTFNRNVETNDLRMDQQRASFIIKSHPEEYAQQLKTCYANTAQQKCGIGKFQQFPNMLCLLKAPSLGDLKLFQSYASGQRQQDMVQQPIIQALVIKMSHSKNYVKVPIKFISVFPRLKVSSTVVEFGEVKERVDNVREITIQNEGERDVELHYLPSDLVRVEAKPILKARSTQKVQLVLRAVKAGSISEAVRVSVFQGLWLQLKVFASCRSSSIRAKRFVNLSSSRDLRKEQPLYKTLMSSGSLQRGRTSEVFNRTDALGDIRTAKLNKLLKQHIQVQNEAVIVEPCMSFRLQTLDNNAKNPFMRKVRRDATSTKLGLKDLMKLATPLTTEQLANIVIQEKEVDFGNMFINCQASREIKITNNNPTPIILQWDFGGNECLRNTNSQVTKIDCFSYRTYKINFKPSSLGAVSLPLCYIINKDYIFETMLTAYVTLVNVQLSTKSLEYCFPSLDNSFEKVQHVQLTNKSQSVVECKLRFQQGKHFHVECDTIKIAANSTHQLKVIYRPGEGEESGSERSDNDKLVVKVVGGAENTIKCVGVVNEARVSVKESEVAYASQIVSTAAVGKVSLKNNSRVETVVRIELGSELKEVLSFDREIFLLNSQQKKQISYTVLCHEARKVSSYLWVHVRAGKSYRIGVELNFVFPEITASREVIDFGNIPIMGNNYLETIVLTSLFKSELKLQFSKKFENEDYTVEIRQFYKPRTERSLDPELKMKKKLTVPKEQSKRVLPNQKQFKLLPHVELCLQVKFIPRKLKQFDVCLPLKLSGTGQFLVEPVNVRLVCCGIEPVVYLQPHFIGFDTRIIGEGKSCTVRSFQIRNPHEFEIDWLVQPQQSSYKNECFYLSEEKGKLGAKESVNIEVMFKPQQEGHFFQRLDVVLKEKKVSHISLQLQGKAIMPSIKFNCNELLMPVVPLGVQSKSSIVLQNHGYDAITITKWKTTTHFQSVQISVNFIEGKLLSLAKKHLKVQVCVLSQCPISFTTFLEFYDELGNKYEVPISCTIDSCVMTTYPYLQTQRSLIYLQKRESRVKLSSNRSNIGGVQVVKERGKTGCEFIKNWMNCEINLSIKKFPECLVESEGELLYRMVNRMSGVQILRRFQSNNIEPFHSSIYMYYSECIRCLKTEGAFLNQIRPQFLLPFKYYKAYLNSKNALVQSESNFIQLSVNSWTALFYQLVRLYIEPMLSDKMVNKFASNSAPLYSSVVYSPSELLVFKFLNAFSNDNFYDLNEQVKFLEVMQSSLQKALGLNLSSSLHSLKLSAVASNPTLYVPLVSKFIFQQLREYGLCQFLAQTDLASLSTKQLILTLFSFITMLYHYSSPVTVCFQASIGDKITKIIDIENPVGRKAKYKLKLIGSEQLQLGCEEVSLSNKGKAQARVSYHCRQNKPLQGKLLLIPIKEDNSSSICQPMAFKLTTSILSKITLRKMEVSARLYEVSNVCVQVQLPMEILEVCEFSVSLHEEEEGVKSFYCFGQMTRILKNNRDKLDIKLLPLTLDPKFCRLSYRSSIYGEFNFEITAKVELSPNIKEIRLKQLKVNKDEVVSIAVPKENEQLTEALKFLNEHHIKTDLLPATKRSLAPNKYCFSIVESSYISIQEEYCEIPKFTLEGKDSIRVDLNCSFGKPFPEYTCTMMLKNDTLKDVRLYKLVASVAMKPKVVPLFVRARAHESATIKIPVKIAPCECIIQNPSDEFNVCNFSAHLKQNVDLMGVFSPTWMGDKTVSIIAQNRQTLEQVIYQIGLKADEPACFDSIKLEGSTVFSKKVRIPINLAISEELRVQCLSKRVVLERNSIDSKKKWIDATILPQSQQQMSNIKLVNNKNGHYFWASLFVSNKKLTQTYTINLEEKPTQSSRYLFEQLPLGSDYQVHMQSVSFLRYEVVNKSGANLLEFVFRARKEMQVSLKVYVMVNSNEYVINVACKCPALPVVVVPQIFSTNLAQKTTSLLLVNSCDLRGVYKARVQPCDIFSLECWEFEVKPKQKKEIKVHFVPQCLQTKYKAVIRFECDTLPTYEYHLNGISEFNSCEKVINCLIYNDQQVLTDIYFTNHFAKSEDFTIDQHFHLTPFELVEPTSGQFKLEGGCTKKIIVKSNKCDRSVLTEGALQIKLSERRWKYRLVPVVIKNLTSKKYVWSCKARETLYQNIELPDIVLHSIESPPEISPYLTYSLEEGTNHLKIKYTPLKPLPKHQHQIFLLTDKFKYVINCIVSVSEPDFDDTIVIKTKEINEVGCVVFKLTNIKKVAVPFKVYFMKGEPDLTVQTDKSTLQGYGRLGTAIKVKFVSSIYNKRVQDELWVETSEMVWRFKVKAVLSKKVEGR